MLINNKKTYEIKEILNILESFQDNGNPSLTVGKKGKYYLTRKPQQMNCKENI